MLKISALDRLRFYRASLAHDVVKQAENDYEWFRRIVATLEPYLGDLKGKTILDVGCGRRYPLTLLLHSFGNKVVGIDLAYVGINTPSIVRWWRALRADGLEALARSFSYTILMKDRAYYKTVRRICDFPLTTRGIEIRRMNVEHLAFSDETFDIVVSVAVFEHVANVPKAASELKRVMKKGGVIYITIHVFTSLSGGHHPDWTDPCKVPPWDHLRQKRYPVPVYLNKLRKHEFLSIFGKEFEILEVLEPSTGVGKDLLTPEIRAELLDYSEEELLKGGIAIVAKKEAD